MINDAGEVIPGARKLAYSNRNYIEGEDPNASVFNKLAHFFPPVNVKEALANGIHPETIAAIEAIRVSIPEPAALKQYFNFKFDIPSEKHMQYRICAELNGKLVNYTLTTDDESRCSVVPEDKEPLETRINSQIVGYLNELFLVCMDLLEANEPWQNILGEFISALGAMKSRESFAKLSVKELSHRPEDPLASHFLKSILGHYKSIQGLASMGVFGDVLMYDESKQCVRVDHDHPRNRFIGVMQRFSCRHSWFYEGLTYGRRRYALESTDRLKALVRVIYQCKGMSAPQLALYLFDSDRFLPKAAFTWANQQMGIELDDKPLTPPTPKPTPNPSQTVATSLFGQYVVDRPAHLEEIVFEGADYRDGKDVDEHDFINTFGFRGVQFGNWLSQKERQAVVNMAFDSFYRIAVTLKLSTPKAVSLGGKLAIAFGARGTSKAMAHYEPALHVVNLTKMRGAGSLFHEYVHAIDNLSYLYLDKQAHLIPEHKLDIAKPYLSLYTSDKCIDGSEIHLKKAYSLLKDAISHAEDYKPVTRAYIIGFFMCERILVEHYHRADRIKIEQLKHWMHEHYLPNLDPATKQWNDEYRLLLDKTKATLGFVCRVPVKKINSILHSTTFDLTHFEWNALLVDKGRHSAYWSSPLELYARAFESFMCRHMETTGQRTDYLVYGVNNPMTYPAFNQLSTEDLALYTPGIFEYLKLQIELISI
jgi:hypothetical protein